MNEVDDNCRAHIPPSICANNRDPKKKKEKKQFQIMWMKYYVFVVPSNEKVLHGDLFR